MIDKQKNLASEWFVSLRDSIVDEFLAIEKEFSAEPLKINRKKWDRPGGGGGEMTIMYGKVFEKVGVNISTVHGKIAEKLMDEVPGAKENDGKFWASGISIVSHMHSPLVPAAHMNTRFIVTAKSWFGGGIDFTPTYCNDEDYRFLHGKIEKMCNEFNPNYYPQFKKQCDDYFFLHHRKEPRGIGGIFYDNLSSDSWEGDFAYTQAVGRTFLEIYPSVIRKHMSKSWTEEQKEYQLIKRGRYVEFNLLYDRGTKFGILTNGNPDAIMMSMPPLVKWK